ncbi:uncharacterized protein B0J16DRAFT_381957 [Fusarium flagelliforme]|uniref:uncharacterized protein n=1 Tax=Fusarium flagelliforme TaxID=2675880 RepID=UPI001E8ECD86|nr:uncharacterized protein B0J16DRAFT_381957 [Fusarium flagelliforme]KAH7188071.1 hypothetical protein B0J16DRAFT_381957 [Fusarium flagelliforme]
MFTANFSSLAKSEATKRLIAQLVNEKLVAISLPAGVDQSRAYITGLDDTTQWMTLPVAKGLGLSTHFRPNDFEVPVELCSDGREMIEDDPGSIFAFVASWFPCDERTKLSIVDELRNSASMLEKWMELGPKHPFSISTLPLSIGNEASSAAIPFIPFIGHTLQTTFCHQ